MIVVIKVQIPMIMMTTPQLHLNPAQVLNIIQVIYMVKMVSHLAVMAHVSIFIQGFYFLFIIFLLTHFLSIDYYLL